MELMLFNVVIWNGFGGKWIEKYAISLGQSFCGEWTFIGRIHLDTGGSPPALNFTLLFCMQLKRSYPIHISLWILFCRICPEQPKKFGIGNEIGCKSETGFDYCCFDADLFSVIPDRFGHSWSSSSL